MALVGFVTACSSSATTGPTAPSDAGDALPSHDASRDASHSDSAATDAKRDTSHVDSSKPDSSGRDSAGADAVLQDAPAAPDGAPTDSGVDGDAWVALPRDAGAFALPAGDYLVATTGSDANDGLSLAAPFLTIGKCAAVAVAGKTCFIRAGTYRESVKSTHSGSSGSPIVFQSVPGDVVIVSGADVVSGAWSVASGSIYKTSLSLDPDHTLAANQLFVDGVMVPEARWPNARADLLDGSGEATAEAGTTATSIVDSHLPGGTGYWNGGHTISHNTLYRTGRDGILFTNDGSSSVKNHTLSYNDIFCVGALDQDEGAIYGASLDFRGTIIDHNWTHDLIPKDSRGFTGPSGYGAQSGAGIYLDNSSTNGFVHHNLTWNNSATGILLNGPNNTGHRVDNNTVGDGQSASLIGLSLSSGNAEMINNIFLGSIPPAAMFPGMRSNNAQPAATAAAGYFVNPAQNDYRLSAASPAIGAGSSVAGVTDGATGTPDQGAYQHDQTAWSAGCSMPTCRYPSPPSASPKPPSVAGDGREIDRVDVNGVRREGVGELAPGDLDRP